MLYWLPMYCLQLPLGQLGLRFTVLFRLPRLQFLLIASSSTILINITNLFTSCHGLFGDIIRIFVRYGRLFALQY